MRVRASCVPRTLSSTARRPSREMSAVSRTSLATARAFSVVSATVWRTSSAVVVVWWIAVSSSAAPLACCAVAARISVEVAASVATASRRWRVTARARPQAIRIPSSDRGHADAEQQPDRAAARCPTPTSAISVARLRSAATSSTTRLRCVWRTGMTSSL